MIEYSKRNSDNPPALMKMEYSLLENKIELLAKTGNEDENFYTRRRGEIEMAWLEDSTDLDKIYVWHASMPLPLEQCKKVFLASHKMPQNAVLSLVFPDYDLNASEMALFEVIFLFGRAKGLEVVASQLYEGARGGDPRAVKMYLELMNLIGSEAEDEDSRVKKLFRISLDL